MNQSKFVELTFLGHNNGGFENKKEWKAFLLFYSQPVAEKGPNFVFGVDWEKATYKTVKMQVLGKLRDF